MTDEKLTRDFDIITRDLAALVKQAQDAASTAAQGGDTDTIYLYAMLGVLSEAQQHAQNLALARETGILHSWTDAEGKQRGFGVAEVTR